MNYIRHLNGFFERLAEDPRLSSYHISLYIALFQYWNANRFSDQFTISRTEVMQLARIGSANTYARCIKELADWGYITYQPSSNLHSGSKVTCTRFDMGSDTAGNTACDTSIKSDIASDIATGTTIDTGIPGNLKSDTGADTTGNTGIKTNTATDTIADIAWGTDITTSTENDTGRSTASGKNDPAGTKSDTGTDTASDTLLINITNKNKLEEEESSKRNSKEKVEENSREKSGERKNPKDLSNEKLLIPELDLITHFFEKNQSSADEAQKFYSHYQLSGWKTADMKTIVSWQAIARKWIENNQNNRTDERESNQVRTARLSVTVNKNYNEPL
ncbi:MAG: hypothetical protein RBS73_07460 [Prolixibacteraceae bacterium]|jgi:hypothetical protein|nr:hypothetical protein [Prolixibacteraceae bacterium]